DDDAIELARFWGRYRAFSGDLYSGQETDYGDAEVDSGLFARPSESDGEAPAGSIIVQVFWGDGETFAEERSAHRALIPDGRASRLRFHLPAQARGPLRLDPGCDLIYGEIDSACLLSGGSRACGSGADDAPREGCLAHWSESNGFAGITAGHD